MSFSLVRYGMLRVKTKRFCAEPITLKCKTKFPTCRLDSLCIQRPLSSEVNYSSKVSSESTPDIGPMDNFITVYKYPYIKYASILRRINNQYWNVIFPIALPFSYGLYRFGLTSSTAFHIAAVMGLLYGLNLIILSHYTKNAVGFVYASHDSATVQIAYIDSDGKRKDEVVSTDDIIPFEEIPRSFSDKFYLKIMRYSKPKTEVLKLDTYHGEILDKDRFIKIFGTV